MQQVVHKNIIISQGSGANVTIAPSTAKAIYLDGAGSGAAVVDAFNTLSLASPTMTGTPVAPTASANTNSTQVATTAYVQTELGHLFSLGSRCE